METELLNNYPHNSEENVQLPREENDLKEFTDSINKAENMANQLSGTENGLLDALEGSSRNTAAEESESLLAPLDEILKDIYDLKGILPGNSPTNLHNSGGVNNSCDYTQFGTEMASNNGMISNTQGLHNLMTSQDFNYQLNSTGNGDGILSLSSGQPDLSYCNYTNSMNTGANDETGRNCNYEINFLPNFQGTASNFMNYPSMLVPSGNEDGSMVIGGHGVNHHLEDGMSGRQDFINFNMKVLPPFPFVTPKENSLKSCGNLKDTIVNGGNNNDSNLNFNCIYGKDIIKSEQDRSFYNNAYPDNMHSVIEVDGKTGKNFFQSFGQSNISDSNGFYIPQSGDYRGLPVGAANVAEMKGFTISPEADLAEMGLMASGTTIQQQQDGNNVVTVGENDVKELINTLEWPKVSPVSMPVLEGEPVGTAMGVTVKQVIYRKPLQTKLTIKQNNMGLISRGISGIVESSSVPPDNFEKTLSATIIEYDTEDIQIPILTYRSNPIGEKRRKQKISFRNCPDDYSFEESSIISKGAGSLPTITADTTTGKVSAKEGASSLCMKSSGISHENLTESSTVKRKRKTKNNPNQKMVGESTNILNANSCNNSNGNNNSSNTSTSMNNEDSEDDFPFSPVPTPTKEMQMKELEETSSGNSKTCSNLNNNNNNNKGQPPTRFSQRISMQNQDSSVIPSKIEESPSSDDSDLELSPPVDTKCFKCSKCKKLFKTSRSLAIHQKRCTAQPTMDDRYEVKENSMIEYLESEKDSESIEDRRDSIEESTTQNESVVKIESDTILSKPTTITEKKTYLKPINNNNNITTNNNNNGSNNNNTSINNNNSNNNSNSNNCNNNNNKSSSGSQIEAVPLRRSTRSQITGNSSTRKTTSNQNSSSSVTSTATLNNPISTVKQTSSSVNAVKNKSTSRAQTPRNTRKKKKLNEVSTTK